MKKAYSRKWLFGALVVVLLGGLWAAKNQVLRLFSGETEAQKEAKIIEADRQVLLNNKGSAGEVFTALVRLGDRRNPLSKQEALKRLKDPSVLIRRGVASALGYFFAELDAREALQKLFSDEDVSVRIAALRAVSDRGGLGRLEFLANLAKTKYALNATTVSELEREAVWAGVLKLSQGPARTTAVAPLLELYNKSKDASVRYHVVLDVLSQMPRDPRAISLLKTDALKSNDPQVLSLAVRHVAALRDRELAAAYKELARSVHLPVRMAVVQSMAMACPVARYEIFEKIVNEEESSDVRNQVFEQMAFLGGKEAEAFAEKLIDSKNLKSGEKSAAKNARDKIIQNGATGDSCKL